MKPINHLHKAAQSYAKLGHRVILLQPGTKEPLPGFRWKEEATNDLDKVDELYLKYPLANIGIVAGEGVDFLDIDGDRGLWSLLELYGQGVSRRHLRGPMTKTPSGCHLWLRSSNLGRQIGFRPGLDYLGTSSYAVCPPSVLRDGRSYRWAIEGQGLRSKPREAHDWLLAALQRVDEPVPITAARSSRAVHNPQAYIEEAVRRQTDRIRGAQPGERRDTVNSAAYSLGMTLGPGNPYTRYARSELLKAAEFLTRTAPAHNPFTSREATVTVNNGLRDGMAKAAQTPAESRDLGIAI